MGLYYWHVFKYIYICFKQLQLEKYFSVRSSTKRNGVYRELVEKDHTFGCYSPVLDTFFSASLRKKLELTVPQCLSGIYFRRRQFEYATQWSVSRTC